MNHYLMVLMIFLMPPLTWILSLLIPRRKSKVAWRECKNKVHIMKLVEDVTSLTPPPGTYVPLTELVEKCYALGTFPALWAVEGMGHYYGETFYQRNEHPRNLLTDDKVSTLPHKSLTMLHAGIGLSFAKRSLQGLSPKSPASDIGKALREFVGLCTESSRKGYLGAAVESLGLVTRFLHGHPMVRIVDRELAEVDRGLVGYFWHGVGRATYFSPPNFVPGVRSPMRAVAMCLREAPHELGRLNMLAGLTWAVTLVNMQHPEVMETLLQHYGELFSQTKAFSNGVASSIMMRYDTSPDDPSISSFCRRQPSSSNPRLIDLWEKQVRGPGESALQRYYEMLKKHNHLEEVFHYQDLAELAGRLDQEERKTGAGN